MLIIHVNLLIGVSQVYLESKLTTEANDSGDVEHLVRRIWRDPCSHSTFSEVVVKVSNDPSYYALFLINFVVFHYSRVTN